MTIVPNSTHINLTAPPPSHKSLIHKGFTLAEVLVTLMVLGVIASMTIPSLRKNASQKELQVGTKKAFSVLNQALYRATMDLGYDLPGCYYKPGEGSPHATQDCARLHEAIIKNLNVIKFCNGSAYNDGCVPDYKGLDTIIQDSNPDMSPDEAAANGCSGFNKSNILNNRQAYVLADGMIIFPYGNNWAAIMAVDVNGKKPPNKWGYDLFDFIIKGNADEGIQYQPQGGCMRPEEGGKYTQQVLLAK